MSELDQVAGGTDLAESKREKTSLERQAEAFRAIGETEDDRLKARASEFRQSIDAEFGALRRVVEHRPETNPELDARVLKLVGDTGWPEEIVRGNYDAIERLAKTNELKPDVIARTAPRLAAWMVRNNGANFGAASDDVETLSLIERYGNLMVGGLRKGGAQQKVGLGEFARMHEVDGKPSGGILGEARTAILDSIGVASSEELRYLEENVLNKYLGEETLPEIAWTEFWTMLPFMVNASAAGMAAAVPVGIAGNVGPQALVPEEIATIPAAMGAGALIYGSMVETGLASSKMRGMHDKDGNELDHNTRIIAASSYGAIAGALEKVGASSFMKMLPDPVKRAVYRTAARSTIETLKKRSMREAVTRYIKDAGVNHITEVSTEIGQEIWQSVMEGAATRVQGGDWERKSIHQHVAELTEVGIRTSLGILPLQGMMGAPRLRYDVRQARRTRSAVARLEMLAETARGSKLRERSPEAFKEAAKAMLGDDGPASHVYVKVGDWDRIMEKRIAAGGGGASPADIARQVMGSEGSYLEARKAGPETDLVIPIEDYLTHLADAEIHDELSQVVRLNQGGTSLREMQADLDDRKNLVIEGLKREVEDYDAEELEIYQAEYRKVLNVRQSSAEADANARIRTHMTATLARRIGMDPIALYRRDEVNMVRADKHGHTIERAQTNVDEGLRPTENLQQSTRSRFSIDREQRIADARSKFEVGNTKLEAAIKAGDDKAIAAAREEVAAARDDLRLARRPAFDIPDDPVEYTGESDRRGPDSLRDNAQLNEVFDDVRALQESRAVNADLAGNTVRADELMGASMRRLLLEMPEHRERVEEITGKDLDEIWAPEQDEPVRLNQKGKRPKSDAGHKREKQTGRYVGAPDWVGSSPQQLAVLRKKLRSLTAEGKVGRYWYEKSARAVLAFVGGDKVAAEKFIGLLAIYSQGTSVPANTTSAIKAWFQWKAGLPITAGRFPASQGPKAKAWLERGQDWFAEKDGQLVGGIKTSNFYTDLMEEIDPSKVDTDHSTMDMWMALAFDYGSKVLDQGPKYMFAQREIAKIAKEMGWRPHQVQAAIWTSIKARVEGSAKERKAYELKNKILRKVTKVVDGKKKTTLEVVPSREVDHFRAAHRFGMQSKITQAEIDASDYDFGTALGQRAATVSWEATPGVNSGVLPGIHTAPPAQVEEYLHAIREALTDGRGRDLIDSKLGLLTNLGLEAPSGWEGKTTLSVQQAAGITVDDGAVSGTSRLLVDLAADIRGMLLAQDAVAWHFPIYTGAKFKQNGVEFDIGRTLNMAETAELYASISQQLRKVVADANAAVVDAEAKLAKRQSKAGEKRVEDAKVKARVLEKLGLDAPPIPTTTGFRVLNFHESKFGLMGETDDRKVKELSRDQKVANESFLEAVVKATIAQPWYDEKAGLTPARFETDGDLRQKVGEFDGSTYASRIGSAIQELDESGDIGATGLADLQEWVDDDLRPRVERVNEDFADRYGWDQPGGSTVTLQQAALPEPLAPPNDRWQSTGNTGMNEPLLVVDDGFAAIELVQDGRDKTATKWIVDVGEFGMSDGSFDTLEEAVIHAETLSGIGGVIPGVPGTTQDAADSSTFLEQAFGIKNLGPRLAKIGVRFSGREVGVKRTADGNVVIVRGQRGEVNLGDPRQQVLTIHSHPPVDETSDLPEWTRKLPSFNDVIALNRESVRIGNLTSLPMDGEDIQSSGLIVSPEGDLTLFELWTNLPASDIQSIFNDAYKMAAEGATEQEVVDFFEEEIGLKVIVNPSDADLRNAFPGVPGKVTLNQTKTQSFKEWFGESKVVDENGEPLVVYHGGTATDQFDTSRGADGAAMFGRGAYFGGLGVAQDWVKVREEGQVTPVYLSMQSPYDERGKIDAAKGDALKAELLSLGIFEDELVDLHSPTSGTLAYLSIVLSKEKGIKRWEAGGLIRDAIERAGFDGIIAGFQDSYQYVVFEPTQVKSATANRGTFDATDPVILNQDKESIRSESDKIIERESDDWSHGFRYVDSRPPEKDSYLENSHERDDDGRSLGELKGVSTFSSLDEAIRYAGFAKTGSIVLVRGVPAGNGNLPGERLLAEASVSASWPLQSLRQDEEDPRGQIDFVRGTHKYNMKLFEGDDPTTLFHESAHFYLELLGDVAEMETATDQVRADYAAALKWLGVKDRSEIDVKHHEKWAEGFEEYLRRGKAPSLALTETFARARAWMLMVYGKARELVNLSPEIEAVFDRMLASDEEIETARSVQYLSPIPEIQAGMTEAELARYMDTARKAEREGVEELQKRMMADVNREMEDWFKVEREGLRAEVEGQLAQQPVMRALSYLQRGSLPGVDELPLGLQDGSGGALKLSKAKIVERYGDAARRRLYGLGQPYVYTRKDTGVDPEDVAPMLGFGSGQELVEALGGLEPGANFESMVEAELDNRMKQKYGSLIESASETAAAAVDAAVNPQQVEQALIEIRYLARMLRDDPKAARYRPVDGKQLRRQAEQTFAGAVVGTIRPHVYLRSASKHGSEAFEAARKKDLGAAYDAKVLQLWNQMLYRSARDAKNQAEKTVRKLRRASTPAARARRGKAGADYLEQVDSLLEQYEFRPESKKATAKRVSLREWITERLNAQEKGVEQGAIVADERLLERAEKRHYNELPLDELVAVGDLVENIDNLVRLKTTLQGKKTRRDRDQVIELLVASAEANMKDLGTLHPDPYNRTAMDRLKEQFVATPASRLRRMIERIRRLDGDDPTGPWTTHIWNVVADAQAREGDLTADFVIKLSEAFENLPKERRDRLFTDKVHIKTLGDSLTKQATLVVALNWGSESNRARMLHERAKPRGFKRWDEEVIAEILGTLDKQDLLFVQSIWDSIEGLWPEIAAMEKRLTGLEPTKVERAPLTMTVDGEQVTLPGGYYPLVYDRRQSRVGQKQADASEDVSVLFDHKMARAMTPHSHVKERVNEFGAPILLDLNVIPRHMQQVAHDLSHREAVMSVYSILTDDRIIQTLQSVMGPVDADRFIPWIKRIAGDRTGIGDPAMESFLSAARANATVAAMGFKFTVSIQNIGNFSNVMEKVGPSALGRAMRDFYRHPKDQTAFIHSKSGEMKHRFNNLERDIRQATQRLAGKKTLKAQVQRFGFASIQYTDALVAYPGWLAAYREAKGRGIKIPGEKQRKVLDEQGAISHADKVILSTLSGGAAKDIADIQAGGEAMKWATMFYSWFGTAYMRFDALQYDIRQSKERGEVHRDFPGYLARMLSFWIVPALFGEWVANRGPDDDEDWLDWAATKTILYPALTIPFVRDLAGVIESKMSGYQRSVQLGPMGRMIDEVGRTLTTTYDITQGDKEVGALTKPLFRSTGYAFGLPTSQAEITGGYMYDFITGEEDPENVVEFSRDLLYRRPPRSKR